MAEEKDKKCCRDWFPLNWTNETWVFMTMRLYLGLVWLMAGVTKFGSKDGSEFSLGIYNENMGYVAEGIAGASFLPTWMTKIYAFPLGYILIALGIFVLLGLKTRWALIFSGLMFCSLGFGLMASKSDAYIPLIGVYIVINVLALKHVEHNKLALWKD